MVPSSCSVGIHMKNSGRYLYSSLRSFTLRGSFGHIIMIYAISGLQVIYVEMQIHGYLEFLK